jgi:hypothetical protein
MKLVYLPQIALRVVVSGHFVHKTLTSMILVGGDDRGIVWVYCGMPIYRNYYYVYAIDSSTFSMLQLVHLLSDMQNCSEISKRHHSDRKRLSDDLVQMCTSSL